MSALPWRALAVAGLAAAVALAWWSMPGPRTEPAAAAAGVPGASAAGEPRLGAQATLSSGVVQAMVAGNAALARGADADLAQARASFEQAVALDTRYAPAHAALTETLVRLADAGVERASAVLPKAIEHGDVAVDLDPAGARGWAALARAEARWMSDWPRAEMHYRRAISLDPNADRPAAGLGELLAALGRRAEAAKEIERGLAANPRSGTLLLSAGIVYLCGGENDRARQYLVDAAAQGVPPTMTAPWLVRVHAASGATADALAAGRMAGDTSWAAGYAHAAAGRRDEAEQVLTAMGQRATGGYVPALEFAYLKATLGHTDEALTFVETSVSEHSPWVELIAVDPVLAPLRKEPRFAAAVARLKLGEGR